MRDFRELSWQEGTETVLVLLKRLTAMRGILGAEPIKRLKSLCVNIIEGDIRAASDGVYAMTEALLTDGCRRVTGDLFKDLLLDKLFLSPHPFAKMAAANRLDEAVYNAMKEDLETLSGLWELDGETLARFVQERYRELKQKIHPSRDLATRRAEAAWGGGAVRPPEESMPPLPKLPVFLPGHAPSWHYGEEELRDSFVSDEALEEMYHRFMEEAPGWQRLNEDLWNFFAAYGTGDFLRVRDFVYTQGRLAPLPAADGKAPAPLFEDEYRSLLDTFIAFMRGESTEPLLLLGADGMGKTTMLFSAADELPELRLVCVPGASSFAELIPLFDMLAEQPLKFAVAVDPCPEGGVIPALVPANVLPVFVSNKPSGAFGRLIALPELRLESFTDAVVKLLDRMGEDLPRDVVRSACVDHQVDSKGELTAAAAVRVAEALAK